MTPNILIINAHPLLRSTLRGHLERLLGEARIELSDCLAEAQRALAIQPQRTLILLDCLLPDAAGRNTVALVHQQAPGSPIIVVTHATQVDTLPYLQSSGAAGFFPMTGSYEQLSAVVRSVLDSTRPAAVRPTPAASWVPHMPGAPTPLAQTPTVQEARHPALAGKLQQTALQGLTLRQLDVLTLLMEGLSNKHICRRLQLAEGTVKVHVSAVLRALGARTRLQAVLAASRLGFAAGA